MKKIIVLLIVLIIIISFLISGCFLIFPKKHDKLISFYSKEYVVDKSVVASVINIESSYKSDVISNAGAVGLMQLLPTTAFDCARRLKIEITEDDLFKEEINIKLGVFYLSYLLNMFDNNIINTLCAYNWGLQNVKEWIALGNVEKDGTISNIPINETKNYLKKFRLNYFIYKNIYKY